YKLNGQSAAKGAMRGSEFPEQTGWWPPPRCRQRPLSAGCGPGRGSGARYSLQFLCPVLRKGLQWPHSRSGEGDVGGRAMSSPGSITCWINELKLGKRAAAQPLWEDYFQQLVARARRKLAGLPRRAADEEDVALSAFASFCRAAEKGRFPQVHDRHDLW